MAFVAVLFCVAGMLGLTAVVLPNFLGVVGIVAGLGVFAFLHYITWGWWLMNQRRNDADDSDNS